MASASALLYVLLTPEGSNRHVLPAIIGGAVILTLSVNRFATPRFASMTRRGLGGLVMMGATVTWVAVVVTLDGGATSPLNAAFILPLGIAVVGTPSAAPTVGGLVIAGHLAGSALGGPWDGATSLVWTSQFALVAIAISWVAGTRLLQRRQLRDLTADLERLVTRDPLTSLLNRRGLSDALEKMVAEDDGSPTGLLVGDLDRFKDINDRFGHATGDEVLVAAADAITATVAEADTVVARTGGEEFLVVLRSATPAEAAEVAELVRRAVSRCHPTIAVTISLGLATAPRGVKDLDMLHRAADRAMYLAKERGRDQVVVAGTEQLGYFARASRVAPDESALQSPTTEADEGAASADPSARQPSPR